MEYVFEIETPEGTGGIAFGEFMPKDGRKNKYHCWWNGGGIGGDSKSLDKAKQHLMVFIKEKLTERLNGYEEKAFTIRLFLKNATP